jgi:putative tricarboxylic transport membrane protein
MCRSRLEREPSVIDPPPPDRRGIVRAPRDLLAGASLLGLAALALWASRPLDPGTLRAVGPGLLPRATAIGVGAAGLALVVLSALRAGEGLGRWPLRGPLFVTLALVGFALTVRTVGLAIAGPLVVIVSGAASPETRPRELVVFALAMTAFCIGLFRYLLALPIPVLRLPGIVL